MNRSARVRLCRIICLVLCGYVGVVHVGHAQEQRFDRPELTVRVSPAKPYVQEQILHSVRLVSAHTFAELEVDIPEVPGAETIVVMQPNVRPFISYGVEGVIYETTRVLFPEKSGTLHIPGINIKGAITVTGQKVAFERQTEPIDMPIAVVPDAYEGSWWLVSALIEMRQQYETPLDVVRVGDTVRRNITVTAKGSTGEHVPALQMRPSRGLTILPGTPVRRTDKSAAGVTGVLEQAFDITVVENQPVDFGPVRLVWWDAEADAGRRSAAPAIRVEPLPRDVEALKARLMERAYARLNSSRISLLVAGIGVVGLLLGALVILSQRRLQAHDRALLRRARSAPPATEAMQAIYIWAEKSFPDMSAVSTMEISRYVGSDLSEQIDSLSKLAFAHGESSTDFNQLAQRLIRVRQKRDSPLAGIHRVVDLLLGSRNRLPTIT